MKKQIDFCGYGFKAIINGTASSFIMDICATVSSGKIKSIHVFSQLNTIRDADAKTWHISVREEAKS